jgi:hypothetical protein
VDRNRSPLPILIPGRLSCIKILSTSSFIYDPGNDQYVCPAGQVLKTNETWHKHSDGRNNRSAYRFRRFNTPACKGCPLRDKCTQSANGRYIDRSEYADVTEENALRVQANPDYYRKRQQITEHMFGTLKRQRGFTYTLVRKKDPVLGEVGLMFIGYNLGRCVHIMGFQEFIKRLKDWRLTHFFLLKWLFSRLFEKLLFTVHEIIPENRTRDICPYLMRMEYFNAENFLTFSFCTNSRCASCRTASYTGLNRG